MMGKKSIDALLGLCYAAVGGTFVTIGMHEHISHLGTWRRPSLQNFDESRTFMRS